MDAENAGIAVSGVPGGNPPHDVVIGVRNTDNAGDAVTGVDSLDHEIIIIR